MRVWIGGELHVDIADVFPDVRNHVEAELNHALGAADYGKGLVEWAVIPMIFGDLGPPEYKEVRRYHKRRKVFEARIIIDHDHFTSVDLSGKTNLLCKALAETLNWLESMNIKDIDVARLRADFLATVKSHGWVI